MSRNWLYLAFVLVLLLPPSAHAKHQAVRHSYTGWVRVTQYVDCCVTASGARVFYGEAAGPPGVPFGAKVHIPGLGVYTVLDRGPAVYGAHFDIWVPYYPYPGIRDYYRGVWY